MKKRTFFIFISLLCAAGVLYAARSILKQPPSNNTAEIPSTSEIIKDEITLPVPSLKGTMSVEEALNTRRQKEVMQTMLFHFSRLHNCFGLLMV